MNNNGIIIWGYVSATSPTRRTKMSAISISSALHEKQWGAFLMRMILHQELIGWCFLPNSTWCIAFSIERNITKCCSFCEVKSSVWIIRGWILACWTCRLNFHMLMWYISYHWVQTSINVWDEASALFNNCTLIKSNKKYHILVVFCYYYLDHQNGQCAAVLSPTSSEVVCMKCGPSLSAHMPPPSVPNSEAVPEVKKSLGR